MSMTLTSWMDTLDETIPPIGQSPALDALWWAGKADWNLAHDITMRHEGNAECDWVHAWLHRKEGDLTNARYWYRRAGQTMQHGDLQKEWRSIVTALLTGAGY